MNDEDLEIENLVNKEAETVKKKVDGKAKGDRTELHLCKLLSTHFNKEFSRALGSGSRWAQVGNLPSHAKQALSGDICPPEKFKWVIESKGGYEDDIHFENAIDGDGITRFDEFIDQSSRDAEYTKRKPIVCWKRNRKPWIAAIRMEDLTPIGIEKNFPYRLYYRDWIIVSLEKLLEITKDNPTFWFEV